ncbi:MAG: phosphoribosylformylglycinamidine synthase subunit PurL [Candidatus Omnitrophota bacterium]|nr:MAG: phosphoribosylformylglycinamidine synthase subunit PurL [Candidatus Omnitrophota bacterium]
MVWRIDVFSKEDKNLKDLAYQIKEYLYLERLPSLELRKIYLIEGDFDRSTVEKIASLLLIDRITETYTIANCLFKDKPQDNEIIITYHPGVCDEVAISLNKALQDLNIKTKNTRTARFYKFPDLKREDILSLAPRLLYNPLIEHLVEYEQFKNLDTLDSFLGKEYEFNLKVINILDMNDEELEKVSKENFLSLNLDEMKVIKDYFKNLERNPTDCELETIAQTWSEHCAHKTFRGIIEYEERDRNYNLLKKQRIDNLLKSTVMKATYQINSCECVSVFEDNAGIVNFNQTFNLCFKIETHNHPSSLEPYGGSSTGIGGVIRDILGTGRCAKPVASIDVFCFAPWQISYQDLPKGVLHPKRIIKGVVKGVRDYGNKMGIPTIGGAVIFDERFLGNPLVYCGTLGLIPKEKSFKEVKPGDLIILCGAKTGRDGIHGATFSSTELAEDTVSLRSAVQIGNPIEEKKLMEALLRARDKDLFSAITDCGAGGLSSAVSELSKEWGAKVYLDRVPLKYRGLTYTEIWISESQERMVIFTQKEKLKELKEVFDREEVELTVIGEVTSDRKLTLFYQDKKVCQLDMDFLFRIPRFKKKAVWIKREEKDVKLKEKLDYAQDLKQLLASLNVSPKDWIVTEYDHEVQGASVVKPILNQEKFAVSDASVIRPDLESEECVAVGLGINPFYSDIDPYWMAALSIDEAIRNVICVGGKLGKISLLDNFSWGSPNDERILAGLVRASFACYDFAVKFSTPFISGKDSLFNEYLVGNKRISIPGTLLISAVSIISDWRRILKNYFKNSGNLIYIVGATYPELGASEYFRNLKIEGGCIPKVRDYAKEIFLRVSQAIEKDLVESCHDCSEGGLGVAISEMCIGGNKGASIFLKEVPHSVGMLSYEILFSESPTRFIVEVRRDKRESFQKVMQGVPLGLIGCTSSEERIIFYNINGKEIINISVDEAREAWLSTFKEFR